MNPSEVALSPLVAALPIVLTCNSCGVTTTLGPDRDAQRVEVAAFFGVHSGHGAGTDYTVSLPLPVQVPLPRVEQDAPAVIDLTEHGARRYLVRQ